MLLIINWVFWVNCSIVNHQLFNWVSGFEEFQISRPVSIQNLLGKNHIIVHKIKFLNLHLQKKLSNICSLPVLRMAYYGLFYCNVQYCVPICCNASEVCKQFGLYSVRGPKTDSIFYFKKLDILRFPFLYILSIKMFDTETDPEIYT